jgi:hypothetical protein
MAADEMFGSAARTAGDLAGVFEYDGETGYFYLYDLHGKEGHKVAAAIQVVSGSPDFHKEDVAIRWDASERMVGLFIKQQLWAVFDGKTRVKYGGNYQDNTQPSMPEAIVCAFESK